MNAIIYTIYHVSTKNISKNKELVHFGYISRNDRQLLKSCLSVEKYFGGYKPSECFQMYTFWLGADAEGIEYE